MKIEDFEKAQYIRKSILDLSDKLCQLRYNRSEIDNGFEKFQEILLSIDSHQDCHSIPISKDLLLSHIDSEITKLECNLARLEDKFKTI